uniref:Reverse transcriptase zinc-binding domain-containing protein n=1 Tax=Ditylenchus dipsaci TaxID=166011 RepID=A0A915ES94_9BILA
MEQARQATYISNWKSKPTSSASLNFVDIKLSSLWISRGALSAKNFRDAISVSESLLYTRVLSGTNIGRAAKCRWCALHNETTEHVVVGCPHFRTSIQLSRHNNGIRVIWDALCRKHKFHMVHYSHEVIPVYANDSIKMLHDQPL